MDLIIFQFFHNFAGRYAFLDSVGIFFAKYLPYLMVIALIIFLLKQKGWQNQIYLFIQMALAAILSRGLFTEIIRFLYNRERPFSALGFQPLISDSHPSFPSGHMTFYFALALVIFYVNRRWGRWFLILTILVGLARIFVGVHWPSDILGGIAVAIISFLIITKLLKKYNKDNA